MLVQVDAKSKNEFATAALVVSVTFQPTGAGAPKSNDVPHRNSEIDTNPEPWLYQHMARNSRKPLILRLAWVVVPVVALLGLAAFWYSGVLNNPLGDSVYSSFESMPSDGRPAFLATQDASLQVPPNATLKQRLWMAYQKLQRKRGKKNPASYTFPASPQPVGCLLEGCWTSACR
jgi:hypothetical protein